MDHNWRTLIRITFANCSKHFEGLFFIFSIFDPSHVPSLSHILYIHPRFSYMYKCKIFNVCGALYGITTVWINQYCCKYANGLSYTFSHRMSRVHKSVVASIIYLPRILCLSFVLSYSCRPVILSSCHICGTLSYSLCFSNQTDNGDQTEGL